VLLKAGKLSEAETLEREALAASRRSLGPTHQSTLDAEYDLACVLVRRGERREALALLAHVLDHDPGPDVWRQMRKDPDLASLRGDPEFERMLAVARERGAPH